MSIHIDASPGAYAEFVLLPGDPVRAQSIAENLLEDVVQVNHVRGMWGFTGSRKGTRVSIQATGMGGPSASIYIHELIHAFGARRLVRIGTCGALQPDLALGDVVLAMSASTNSHTNRLAFDNMDFAPCASFDLLRRAADHAARQGIPHRVGGVMSSDTFYARDEDAWKLWAGYGVLAMEMETSALYTLAARSGVEALSILTVTDSLVTGDHTAPTERENACQNAARIALALS